MDIEKIIEKNKCPEGVEMITGNSIDKKFVDQITAGKIIKEMSCAEVAHLIHEYKEPEEVQAILREFNKYE